MRNPSICRTFLNRVGRLLAVGVLATGALAAQGITQTERQGFQPVVRVDSTHARVHFTLGGFTLDTVMREGQTFSRLTCEGANTADEQGFAGLPYFTTALHVPADQRFHVVTEDVVHEEMPLDYPLLSAEEQNSTGFVPEQVATTVAPFLFHELTGQTLYFHPVQYNAATQTLRITRHMTVRLEAADEGDMPSPAIRPIKVLTLPPPPKEESSKWVYNITPKDIASVLEKSKTKMVILDLSGKDCCGCKSLHPFLCKFANEDKGRWEAAVIDCHAYPDIAKKENIQCLPTQIAYRHGKEVARQPGFCGGPWVRSWLDRALKAADAAKP